MGMSQKGRPKRRKWGGHLRHAIGVRRGRVLRDEKPTTQTSIESLRGWRTMEVGNSGIWGKQHPMTLTVPGPLAAQEETMISVLTQIRYIMVCKFEFYIQTIHDELAHVPLKETTVFP